MPNAQYTIATTFRPFVRNFQWTVTSTSRHYSIRLHDAYSQYYEDLENQNNTDGDGGCCDSFIPHDEQYTPLSGGETNYKEGGGYEGWENKPKTSRAKYSFNTLFKSTTIPVAYGLWGIVWEDGAFHDGEWHYFPTDDNLLPDCFGPECLDCPATDCPHNHDFEYDPWDFTSSKPRAQKRYAPSKNKHSIITVTPQTAATIILGNRFLRAGLSYQTMTRPSM